MGDVQTSSVSFNATGYDFSQSALSPTVDTRATEGGELRSALEKEAVVCEDDLCVCVCVCLQGFLRSAEAALREVLCCSATELR